MYTNNKTITWSSNYNLKHHQYACVKQTILCITFLTSALCDMKRNICRFTSINFPLVKKKSDTCRDVYLRWEVL